MSKKSRQLRNENNELSGQISFKNNQVLTDMVVYIRNAGISEYQQERVRRDITQMILEGERRGDEIGNVIGENYQVFCNNVLSEVPKLNRKEKIVSFIGTGSLSLMILSLIWLAFQMVDLFTAENTFPYFPVTLGNVVSAVLMLGSAIGFLRVLTKNAFQDTIFQNKKPILLFFWVLFVCIVTNVVLKKILFSIHAAVIILAILVLFLIYKVIDVKEE